jgi:T1SS-143 domain-containing protein
MAEQAQVIGKAMIVYGTVKAESTDGVARVLQPNSPIFINDRINTGSDGAVSIVFNDAVNTQLDLGRMTDMVIDESTLSSEELNLEDVTVEVEAIQEALETGEEIVLEETAAGGAAAGAGGGGFVLTKFAVDGNEGEVTSGAETVGVDYDFTGSEQELILEPQIIVPEPVIPEAPEPEAIFFAAEAGTTPPAETTSPPLTTPPPPDGEPTIGSDEVVIDETFFDPTGDDDTETSPPDQFPTSLTGSVDVDFGLDGPGSIYGSGTFGATAPEGLANLQSQGRDVTVTVDGAGNYIGTVSDGGEGTIKVFELIFNDAVPGEYTYTQFDQLDHPDDMDPNDQIALTFGVTIEDSNGDTADGTVTVNVLDDEPVAIGEAQTLNVYEDALQNNDLSNEDNYVDGESALSDDNPATGNLEGEVQDDASIDLWQFVDIGADDYPEQSEQSPFSLTGAGTSLDVTSKGEPIVIKEISSTHIQGVVEGGEGEDRVVFEIFLDGSNLIFDLDDQIDHEGLGDSEFLSGGETDDSFDIGRFVKVTDYDGDSILLDGKIIIDVENDVPELRLEGVTISGTVQEDALGNSPANTDNDTDADESIGILDTDADTDSTALDLNELIDMIDLSDPSSEPGADEPALVTFTLLDPTSLDGDVNISNETSNGDTITYTLDDTDTDNPMIVATADAGGDDARVVFTFTVTSAGAATFNLNDQIDHPEGSGDDYELSLSELGQFVDATMTDADGDSDTKNLAGKININIENDVPELRLEGVTISGTVQEDALGNSPANTDNDTDADESIGILDTDADTDSTALDLNELIDMIDLSDPSSEPGADEPALVTFTLLDPTSLDGDVNISNETSNGDTITYTLDDTDTDNPMIVATADAGGDDARVVFTFTVTSAGAATFNLNDQIDHPEGSGDDYELSLSELGQFVDATMTDADGDSDTKNLAGKININIENDIPEADSQASAIVASVLEDGMSEDAAAPTVDFSEGIKESGETIADDEDSGGGLGDAANNISTLFDSGADEPFTTYGIVDQAQLAANLDGLQNLTSNGKTITYTSDGNTLTAETVDNTVFTLTVNTDGSWVFDLQDQLDHVAPDGVAPGSLDPNTGLPYVTDSSGNVIADENWDLRGSNAENGGIDFSSVITATDKDGDTTIGAANDKFVVRVQDDIPEAVDVPDSVPQNMNILLIVDNSGSMDTDGRIADLNAAIQNMFTKVGDNDYLQGAQDVRVHVVSYSTEATTRGTFDLKAGGADQNATWTPIGTENWTNYEDGMFEALKWIDNPPSGEEPLAGPQTVNKVIFISDGLPNTFNRGAGDDATPNTNESAELALDHVTGDVPGEDTVSELAALKAWSTSGNIDAVGINLGALDDSDEAAAYAALGEIASDGGALINVDPLEGDDLGLILGDLLPIGDPIIEAYVKEDGMDTEVGDPDDASDGNREAGETTADDEAGSVLGDVFNPSLPTLADLFESGADEPLSFSLVTDSDYLQANLPTLYSKGVELFYESDGTTLVAYRSGEDPDTAPVFTLTITDQETGAWSFDLDDQLDHVDNNMNDENIELVEGAAKESSVFGIDFSPVIVATDADDDQVIGADDGAFVVRVEDDVPETQGEEVPRNLDLLLVIDRSGSMAQGTTRLADLQLAVAGLLTSLSTSAAANVRVHIADFAEDSNSVGTFVIKQEGGNSDVLAENLTNAINGVNALRASGSTNWEGGLREGIDLFNSAGAFVVDGEVVQQALFFSDGDPNKYINDSADTVSGPGSGYDPRALAEVHGEFFTQDQSDEIQALEDLGFEVRAIGIEVTDSQLERLSSIDSTKNAIEVDESGDLVALLPQLIVPGNPAQDSILVNEAGNELVASLNIDFGADEVAQTVAIAPVGAKDGDQVVDTNGNVVTYNGGTTLTWQFNTDGSVSAVDGGTEVFTVAPEGIPGAYTGNYIVEQVFALDMLVESNLIDFTIYAGSTPQRVIDDGKGMTVTITPTDNDPTNNDTPDGDWVTWDIDGMGVGFNGGSPDQDTGSGGTNQIDEDTSGSEILRLDFSDSNTGAALSMDSVTFDLSDWDNGDQMVWTAYDSDGLQVATGTYDYDTNSLAIDPDGLFSRVDLAVDTTGSSEEFGISTVQGTYQGNYEFDFDAVATDQDGDSVETNFEVAFDADGVVQGDDFSEVIAGGSGADVLSGGGGDDVIIGDGGNDYLYGEAGDDTLLGGTGEDKLIGGEGSDNLDGGGDADILVGDAVDFGTPDTDDSDIIEDAAQDIITGGTGDDVIGDVPAADAANDDVTADPDVADNVVVGTDDADIDTLIPPPEVV